MGKKFDPKEYETVESRIKKFYKDYENGRITTKSVIFNANEAGFKSYIFKNEVDQKDNLPWATGYAYELRDVEKKKTQYGKEYESVNYTSWTENAETSAIGRALANAGYMGSKRPTKQEMDKSQRMSASFNSGSQEDDDKPWLNDGALEAVKAKLDSEEVTMDQVYKKYKVSKKSKAYLVGETIH